MSNIDLQSAADGIHPNFKLLSNHSSVLQHKCPKKFELYRLKGLQGKPDEDEDGHLTFGDMVGKAVQDYLTNGDIQRATFNLFCGWPVSIDDDRGVDAKKTFWHALYALDKFSGFRKTVLSNYNLVLVDGKPATELGFIIDLGDGFTYRGFLDALLYDTILKKLIVLECKTTKYKNVHEANYKNSPQGLGYSLVLDAIAKLLGIDQGASYKVLFPVYKTFAYEWELFTFPKSYTERAQWIRNILRDKQHIAEYALDGYFPMHGENCYDFFKPCTYFGVCSLGRDLLVPNPKVQVEDMSKYPFKFTIDEIIEAQLAL